MNRSAYATTSYQYDEGLRKFMLNMFNHTAMGLAVSGVVAYFVYATGLVYSLMSGPLAWVVMLAPLGMIFWYSFAGRNWELSTTKNFYYAFTAVMGIGLSALFAVYTAYSLVQVFFITSATFAGASIYGYSTKKDLTSMGSFLIIGLIGIIIASIVNIFLASSGLHFAISIIGVLIFTGLTAWDTQRAKQIYNECGGDERYGVQFALSLYLNFINLFQMLLALLGNREQYLLTTKDHWVCGIFALLMYISLKITLSPTVLSLFGAFLLYWNWRSFLMYCEKRRVGEM